MTTTHAAAEWYDRLAAYLQAHGATSTCVLGQAVARPREMHGHYYRMVALDARFVVRRFSDARAPLVSLAGGAPPAAQQPTKRRRGGGGVGDSHHHHKKSKQADDDVRPPPAKPSEPFVPTRTGFEPPQACWDIVLGTRATWTGRLRSWRWILQLSLVGKAFADALRPLRTELIAAMADADSLVSSVVLHHHSGGERAGIWKTRANALFGLSMVKELATLPYRAVELSSLWGRRDRVMHVLSRADVLRLAFARHGHTFEAINDAFISRKARLVRLRGKRYEERKRKYLAYAATTTTTTTSDDDDDDDTR